MMINIVGLGPGDKDALTIGALNALKSSEHVYLRTEKHPVVEYLKSIGIKFETFDSIYNNSSNFDEVYENISEKLIEEYKKYGNIVYAVPGHPEVAEKSVKLLINFCKKNKIETRVVPAVSFIDVLMERLNIDAVDGIKVIDAFDIKKQILDKRNGLIITQVYNRLIASEVKIALMDYYKDDTFVYFIRAAGIRDMESIRKIPIYEIDRQKDIDHLTSIYVPESNNEPKDFFDLLSMVKELRSEDGCLEDMNKTHKSLKKNFIEGSSKFIQAIDKDDNDKMIEELGDMLFQIVFHAQIGREEGFFDINEVIEEVCGKIVKVHPHIF